MNTTEFYQSIKPLLQREFVVSDTLKLISANKSWFWSWGSNSPKNIENKGLMLNVTGHHHKGKILITLGWNDTYTLSLINPNNTIKETITDIYFDELAERIDTKIERIGEYQR